MPTQLMKIPSMTFLGSISTSMLGFAIVFFVLIALMYMILALRGFMEKREAGKAAAPAAPAAPSPAAAATAAPASNMVPAKGSLGEVKLHDVDDKSAALIMAIVANEMNAPLNELRFLSIREKK